MDLNRGWKGREEAAESLGQQDFLGFELKKSMVTWLLSLMFKLLFLVKSDDPDV